MCVCYFYGSSLKCSTQINIKHNGVRLFHLSVHKDVLLCIMRNECTSRIVSDFMRLVCFSISGDFKNVFVSEMFKMMLEPTDFHCMD